MAKPKLLNAFFLLFAAAMIVVVGFGDPGAVNRAVNDFFGWAPNPPVEARMVDSCASRRASRFGGWHWRGGHCR